MDYNNKDPKSRAEVIQKIEVELLRELEELKRIERKVSTLKTIYSSILL